MIVDTSAIIAILREESDAEVYARAIAATADRCMSAASFVEAAAVIDGSGDPVATRDFDRLLREARISIEPVTEAQARIAREAYRDFGKSRHRAGLNFGDCFAYALAKDKGQALLFKGNDFSHTDVVSALQANR